MKFLKYIAAGQGAMTLCCLIYAAWWYVAYNPKVNGDQFSGTAGILFWLTFACGTVGMYLNISGIRNLADTRQICLIGVVAYIALLTVTVLIFHRQVTAELFLIVAWATMEIAAIFAVYNEEIAAGNYPTMLLIVVAATTIFSMVAYLVYYRVEEWKAFYLGLLPLIADAIGTAIISFFVISKFGLKI